MPSEIEAIHNLVPLEGNLLILIDIKFLIEENALYLFIYTDIFKVPAENQWGRYFINTVSCGRYISYNVPAEGIKYITKLLQFNTAQDCRDL